MAARIAKLLTWASVAACLIVAVSFAIFALDQTSSASNRQQEEVSGQPVSTATSTAPGAPAGEAPRESTIHKTIDEVSAKLTSPFSGITAGSSSEWVVRGVGLLGALLLYGLGVGYLARVIRIRV